jgi:elongation factor P
MKANRLKPGHLIVFEGDLWRVFQTLHQTPGNLRARVQTKLRNLRNGTMKDHRFRSEDEVERAHLDSARCSSSTSRGTSATSWT